MLLRHAGLLLVVISIISTATARAEPPPKSDFSSELLFPVEHWHNHGSSIVECANGDLLVCWYHGSGERRADDVIVEGARRRKGETAWSPRFLMADTPGFPDTNPCLLIDPRGRLWLIWQAIIANEWHTALTKYKIASEYTGEGPPKWESSDTLLLKPGPEFAEIVARQCDADEAKVDQLPEALRARSRDYLAARRKNAADKYFSRMGWMTRVHPFVLDNRRLIVPLYSDGFDFSIMALSDDWGATWTASTPLVSAGGVQPSVVRKKDGTLVAWMRDNGPPPKRVLVSESKDEGKSWGPVTDSDIPNSGASVEVIALQNGEWLMVNNNTEQGRHKLAVSISDDEGRSWKWTRYLESHEPGPDATSGSYPSVIQAKDGTVHVTYSLALSRKAAQVDNQERPQREAIKHAQFPPGWVKSPPEPTDKR